MNCKYRASVRGDGPYLRSGCAASVRYSDTGTCGISALHLSDLCADQPGAQGARGQTEQD